MKKIQFNPISRNFSIPSIVISKSLNWILTHALERGYQLSFLNPKKDTGATLTKYEERLYDHIVLFPQKLKGTTTCLKFCVSVNVLAMGSNLTPQILVEFLNDGGNILLAASPSTSESLRDFARELDIDLPPRDSLFADHFSFHSSSPKNHTLVVLDEDNFLPLPHVNTILSEETRGKKFVYRGAAHGLGTGPFLLPLIRGKSTSYVYDGKEDLDTVEDPYVSGTQAFLVSAFQARNNARVVVTSSLDMFSDEYSPYMTILSARLLSVKVDGKENGNKALADDLTAWVFQETLVIKSNYLQHQAPNSTDLNPKVYRVETPVTVSLSLSKYNPTSQSWEQFTTPENFPVQLSVNMLDPYIRTALPPTSSLDTETIYSRTFILPDHYGVFNFKVEHRVPGYTYIYEREQFTIRHRQHNEYPRFITGAWSYYTGWLSVVVGFLVFSAIWLYHTPKPPQGDIKAKKSE
jgi:oligosaccharyltransferase complex subunit beta